MYSSGTPQQQHGYIPFSNAWYRTNFTVAAGTALARLHFDGCYRSCTVFLNGAVAGHHEAGYTAFDVWLHNVSGAPLVTGGGTNTLAVHVDATTVFELWSYEGAGITRPVSLVTHTAPCGVASVVPWGVAVRPAVVGPVSAPAGRTGPQTADGAVAPLVDIAASGVAFDGYVTVTVYAGGGGGGAPLGSASAPVHVAAGATARVALPNVSLPAASLWFPADAPDAPDRPLYSLLAAVMNATGGVVDSVSTTFGFRTVVFDANAGLAINGFPLHIRGVSMHQDFACVGAAVPRRLVAYRMQRLLEMGANGYRTAHNPHSADVVAEADRRGLMVWSETRFLREFADTRQDAVDMVLRDRNAPSVIMWSLW